VTSQMEFVKSMETKPVPQAKCPHCKKPLSVDIEPFKKDMSKIYQSNCPYCRGEIFTGLILLAHPKLKGLLASLQMIIDMIGTKESQTLL